MKHLPILLVATVLCQLASGQDRETGDDWTNYADTAHDVFNFFNTCEGMAYHVSVSGEGSHDSALRSSDVENAVESRLRAARIFDEDAQRPTKSYFNVYVTLSGSAASVIVSFEKPGFVDPYSRHRLIQFPRGMETWRRGWLVQGGFRPGDVLADLSKYLDEFIVGYLRVNTDEACERFRNAEQEHRAKVEADRAAERAAREARAARWKGWSAEQCQSLEEYQAECLLDAIERELEE